MTKRATLLFGAGAVFDWKGPSTPELTDIVRKSGFNLTNNQTKITDFIYQTLTNTDVRNNPNDINFETIISVIEEFIVYYSYFDKNNKSPSLLKNFFNPKYEEQLLNFSIEGGQPKHLYKLEIPKGQSYDFAKNAYNNEAPEQFFFQHLLAKVLTNINARVSKYAYHTEGHTQVLTDTNSEINSKFCDWVSSLLNENIIKIYTLNYDKIFKTVLENRNILVFDGFKSGDSVSYGEFGIPPDILRIIKDTDPITCYNLHGSAFWEVISRGHNQLPNPEIRLFPYPILEDNNHEQSTIQIEKGKNIVLTNIITGYQKAQKSFATPYKQMQAAFDKDCCIANSIYIIGYSFGDEHINASIKTALKYNHNLTIYLVDPAYNESNNSGYKLLRSRFISVFTEFLSPSFKWEPKGDKCCSYFNGKLTVYTVGFKEFMEMVS